MPVDTRTSRMDLTFSLAERFDTQGAPAGIGGAVEFRTDVFDQATIHTLVARFERVLTAMTIDPGRRVSSIDVLDTAEHARLAQAGHLATLTGPAPAAASIPEVFAHHVIRAPGAVAISDGALSLSYREVDEASNRLAHLLVGRGAGPGRVVAVLMPRTAGALVGIMAVLKTGAAYLPIDAGAPAARIGFVLADSAPIAVLASPLSRPPWPCCAVAGIPGKAPPLRPEPPRARSLRSL